MSIKYCAVIQARLTSTRLPSKIFLNIEGATALGCCIDGVQQAKRIDRVAIAIPDDKSHDPLAKWIELYYPDTTLVRGSELDVMSRYWRAAEVLSLSSSDVIVRATSDCPLISPREIDAMVGRFQEENIDYLANTCPFPGCMPDGFDVEVFSVDAIDRLMKIPVLTAADKEHVTPAFLKGDFRAMKSGESIDWLRSVSLSLDTREDYFTILEFLRFTGGLVRLRELSPEDILRNAYDFHHR